MRFSALVGGVVACLRELETMTAELYRSYAARLEKSSGEAAAAALRIISFESEAHAEILAVVARLLDSEGEARDCSRILGEPWSAVERLLSDARRGSYLELSELIERASWFEDAVGEETYARLAVTLIGQLSGPSGGERSELTLRILEKIARDEEWHEELLRWAAASARPQ
ncbi:MAG: hypothetical protein QXU97_04760 [Fervidicoccaceae archaeon]